MSRSVFIHCLITDAATPDGTMRAYGTEYNGMTVIISHLRFNTSEVSKVSFSMAHTGELKKYFDTEALFLSESFSDIQEGQIAPANGNKRPRAHLKPLPRQTDSNSKHIEISVKILPTSDRRHIHTFTLSSDIVHARLSEIALSAQPLQPIEETGGFKAAYLINESGIKEFKKVVDDLESRYQAVEIQFKELEGKPVSFDKNSNIYQSLKSPNPTH